MILPTMPSVALRSRNSELVTREEQLDDTSQDSTRGHHYTCAKLLLYTNLKKHPDKYKIIIVMKPNDQR